MNQHDHSETRQAQGPLLEALAAAGGQPIRGKDFRCPFHEDKHPSAGIYVGEDGVWRFKCHGCGVHGDVFDIRARVSGRSVADELKAAAGPRVEPKRSWATLADVESTVGTFAAKYLYTNPSTKAVELAVFRVEYGGGKRFLQAHPEGGRWLMSAPPKPWPLYNRARVAAADRVVVVEGEKCVHALHAVGIVATTSPCGAGKSGFADWSPLAGKQVILWPDNDDKGREHMDEVRARLEALEPPCTIGRINPADLNVPAKGDAVEFIAACEHPGEEVAGVLDNAEPMTAAAELRTVMEETIAGKRRNLILPWRELGQVTNMLIPGTVTLLCGDPGCSKSLWMIQAFARLHKDGIPVDLFELEDDRPYHLLRALVQECGDSSLFDHDWVRLNADKARYLREQHEAFLTSFGQRLHDSPTKVVNHRAVLEWIEQRCSVGSEVLGIDPVTAISASEQPWVADQNFITEARRIIRRTGARLLLVTHPKMGSKGNSRLENVAGGAAYQRFSDTVLWLQRHEPAKEVEVADVAFGGHEKIVANRTMEIRKARKGRGGGWSIAMAFEGKSVKFSELGLVAS